jgi:hypothetical protein
MRTLSGNPPPPRYPRDNAIGDTVKFLNTSLLIILAAGLGGCAVYPDSPAYGTVYNNGSGYGNVYNQPPTVVYQQPQPVYVQPRPVYVEPRPIVVEREPYYRYDNRGNRYDDRYRNDNRNDRYDRDDRRPPPQARPQPQQPPQARPQQGYGQPPLVDQVKRNLQNDGRAQQRAPQAEPRYQRSEQPYVAPDTSKN